MTLYSVGWYVQFPARNSPTGTDSTRGEEEREGHAQDADHPSDRALDEAQDEHADEEQDDHQVEQVQRCDEPNDVHASTLVTAAGTPAGLYPAEG